jgi:hypothetical protein
MVNYMKQSFFDKQMVSQLVKKFLALDGTRKFIYAYASDGCLSLCSVQSMTPHPIYRKYILILFFHPGLGF